MTKNNKKKYLKFIQQVNSSLTILKILFFNSRTFIFSDE